MKKITLLLLPVLLLIGGLIWFFTSPGKYLLEVHHPSHRDVVTTNFQVDFSLVGDEAPEQLVLLIDGEAFGTPIPSTKWHPPGRMTVYGHAIDVTQLDTGQHTLQVLVEGAGSYTSDPIEFEYYPLTPERSYPSLSEVSTTSDFLLEDVIGYIIALNRIRHDFETEHWKDELGYQLAKEDYVAACESLNPRLKKWFLQYCRLMESEADWDEIQRLEDLINLEFSRQRLPFYVNIHETRYRKRAPRSIIHSYTVRDSISLLANDLPYHVISLQRLDNLNTAFTLNGHATSGRALTLFDRIRSAIKKDFMPCVEGNLVQCYNMFYSDQEDIDQGRIEVLQQAIAKEIASFFPMDSLQLFQLALMQERSTAIHELQHLLNAYHDFPLGKSVIKLERQLKQDIKWAEENHERRLAQEGKHFWKIHGINEEFSAYLQQLSSAEGSRFKTLTKLYGWARHKNSRNAWASRLILSQLAAQFGMETDNAMQQPKADPIWMEFFDRLLQESPETIATAAAQVFENEFGSYPKVQLTH